MVISSIACLTVRSRPQRLVSQRLRLNSNVEVVEKPLLKNCQNFCITFGLSEPLTCCHFAIGNDERMPVFALSLAPRGFSTASLGRLAKSANFRTGLPLAELHITA